jgi:ribosome biogenesis GTPase A
MEASGRMFIDAFATGKLGRMSLEKPDDPPFGSACNDGFRR